MTIVEEVIVDHAGSKMVDYVTDFTTPFGRSTGEGGDWSYVELGGITATRSNELILKEVDTF